MKKGKKDHPDCCKKSFWESATDTAKRILEDPSLAPVEVRKQRMAICGKCQHFKHNRCEQCSCFMPAKTMLANARCPLETPKWTEFSESDKVEE
jgi:hypothetical protein